jgi:hypothetical protein
MYGRPTTQHIGVGRVIKERSAGFPVALALAVAALAAGCRVSDGASPATTQRPGETSTTIAPASPPPVADSTSTTVSPWNPDEQAIVDVYQDFLVAVSDSAAAGSGDLPSLERTATGDLLTTIRRTLALKDEGGLRTRRAEPSKARATVYWTSVKGDAAHLAACVVDDSVVYRLATGEVVNDSVVTVRKVARFERAGGAWKVAAQQPKDDEVPGEVMDQCLAGS